MDVDINRDMDMRMYKATDAEKDTNTMKLFGQMKSASAL
jgi:hypothetical protein